MADFNKAIVKLLENEGGYVNDPADTGGETNFGISKRAYPDEDIKNITPERVREIYKLDYWDKIGGDEIYHQETAEQLFDFAVNAGVKRASKLIQTILKFNFNQVLKIDGFIGEKTLFVLNMYASTILVNTYKLERLKYYLSISKRNNKFLYTWVKRVLF